MNPIQMSSQMHLLLRLVCTIRALELRRFPAFPLHVVTQRTLQLINPPAFRASPTPFLDILNQKRRAVEHYRGNAFQIVVGKLLFLELAGFRFGIGICVVQFRFFICHNKSDVSVTQKRNRAGKTKTAFQSPSMHGNKDTKQILK